MRRPHGIPIVLEGVILAGCLGFLATNKTLAADADWRLVYENKFGGAVKAPALRGLGEKWVALRGDWYVTKEGRLRTQRIWPSDSAIMLDIPLRNVNVRAEMDVFLGKGDRLTPHLQSGEAIWGGGGTHDAVRARLFGGEQSPLRSRIEAGGKRRKSDVIHVAPHRLHQVSLRIEDGKWSVEVDGKQARAGRVEQGRSLVNRRFAIHAIPNGEIDNLRIYARPRKTKGSIAKLKTEAENRRATVDASEVLNLELPGLGFQKAIDSLPEGGGCVVLPAGRFVLRRHLHLRSGVTLRGQGAGKTVLTAPPITTGKIVKTEVKDGKALVQLKDASGFRKGDAACYGSRWGHPGVVGVPRAENIGVLVLGVQGNTLVLSEPPTRRAKVVRHFFPLVFARGAEFVEVKDLTLTGQPKAETSGGFTTNPITFGACYGSRVTRIEGDGWPGDGVSMQGGADAIVTDNTVRNTAQGFHPGTTTLRYLWSRNLSVGNRLGLYFCWYNSNGVYTRSTLNGFGGYPGQGDFFNVLAFNRDESDFRITNGASGVFFANACKAVRINGRGKASRHLYAASPRYFVVASNRCASVTVEKERSPGDAGPAGNVVAANRAEDGAPSALDCSKTRNVVSTEGFCDFKNIGSGCGRPDPVPPPELPEPILVGASYYRHGKPDCGFQAALDELAGKGGGTLRLPGGRYILHAPLSVPSGVTLIGQGTGTVLVHDPALNDSRGLSLITTASTKNVTIRELTIEGRYVSDPTDRNMPAITVMDAENILLAAIDVRGRRQGSGIGVARSRAVTVRDCRVLDSEKSGYWVVNSTNVRITSSIAVGCGEDGFRLAGVRGNSLVEGNIAARNNGAGLSLSECKGLQVLANNFHYNRGWRGYGIDLGGGVIQCVVAGNMITNNRSGIRIAAGASANRICYNRCGDDRIVPIQRVGIREEKGAFGNTIAWNVTAPHHGKVEQSIIVEGRDTTVKENHQPTLLPSGSSVEEWPQGRAEADRVRVYLDWTACIRQWQDAARERRSARR